MLAFDFEVVGAATDGHQALDVAASVNPDVIVLDVTMPGLNGFQTARELRKRGTRASIVYLTMHDSEEFVAEGFRSGGDGYVLKTRLHVDLMNALDHVLAGQAFVPSLNSLLAIGAGRSGHAAQFYADERTLIDEMSRFLQSALGRGDAVSAVFPKPIQQGLAAHLRARGWDVPESGVRGRFCAIDSTDAVSSIMRNGSIDPRRVSEVIAKMDHFRAANSESADQRLTIVGQIAIPLLAAGDVESAIHCEQFWNEQTRTLPFLTVCCYPITCFTDRMHADVFRDTCAEHWAVAYSPDSGMASPASRA
jgi:CheY-like chemotaxis protein